jgi:hypothetical protein
MIMRQGVLAYKRWGKVISRVYIRLFIFAVRRQANIKYPPLKLGKAMDYPRVSSI